ncbi:MAG: ATP-binding protein [Candidatus Aminicenantes bacterium]|jgi:hypothetical protein
MMLLDELEIHNQFKESIARFKENDPHLKRLKNLPLVYHSSLLDEQAFHTPGIYLITGGRQIGKTTFLKQFILKLLVQEKIDPQAILFISGEIIDTHHILRRMINRFHDETLPRQFLFIDEVNYIPDWDKSIKFLADSGILNNISVILTGSDSRVIRTAMKRFAGRRGMADKVDFEFYPLSFKEFVCLKEKKLEPLCKQIILHPLSADITGYEEHHHVLIQLFYEYLLHGGYLPAINEYNVKKTISRGVMNTYIQWIIGDILKYNKSEHYLFEILKGIKATYNTPISWNNLSRFLSIEHHKTIADYCDILVSMHVLHIQEAVIEHKMTGAPKKNRKVYFRDPFIDHSISCYLDPSVSIERIYEDLKGNEFASSYVEAAAVDHCKRWAPTYYIKGNKGEVDIAVVQENRLYPVEVKWARNVRVEDFKEIQRFSNGILLTPDVEKKMLKTTWMIPLVRFLIHVSAGKLVI